MPATKSLCAGDAELAASPVAEAIGVSKRFGASQALRDVSVAIPPGDSRALVGRNGAGKSTLVGVLTGLLAPDAGQVRFGGEDAPSRADRRSWRERVACVYQKSTVIPTLTVAENLFLNAQPTTGGLIAWAALRRQARRVLEEWGLEVDVDADAEWLSVEQRQIVEIARALLQGTRFIILDEPTAQLEAREVTRLFERIARLQQGGVTFLYISHHLEEIYEVCRSVTVLRDGAVVTHAPLDEMPKDRVVAAMVGDALREDGGRRRHGRPATAAAPMLEVRDLSIPGGADHISFRVAVGETVGLAGLAGSGKEEVGDAIAGLVVPSGGEIRVGGAALRPGQVADAQRKGVGYVPRDRHRRGMVPQLSLAENLTLTITERLGPAGLVWPAERERQAARLVRSLEIVAASTEQTIAELSGGNQQKAVMGRALASEPKVLVVLHPMQGVDIASKAALFAILENARAAGAAVLIVSDDLDELVGCDRVLVMFRGRLVAEFGAEWRDHELVAAIEGVAGGD
ncbi:MAG TPA: sugar ABC transporter ATP-binding protein [Geminicoccaceae bacterium]|nr:sugar ABC transporter ATP-binding protein [Geminicoccaceae bacterium]